MGFRQELDNLAAETASMTIAQITQLAGTVRSQIYTRTLKSFSESDDMFNYLQAKNGQYAPLLSEEVHKVHGSLSFRLAHYIQRFQLRLFWF
jgi:ribonucleoside-diphosphate reductase alpha chain